MTMDIEFELGKAKATLVLDQPFLASIICSLPMEVDATINPPTLCTNGKWIKVHPEFVAGLDKDELVWGLAHETMHCVFQHMLRRGDRDPVLFNVAGDYVINAVLATDKIGRQIKGALFDPELYEAGGKTTEGIYALLQQQAKDGGGKPQQWDRCEDTPGDAAAQAQEAAEWQVKIAQAAGAAKMHGKLSGAMRGFVDELLEPKVKWADQLRDFFTKRVKTDRSYARPNRRFLSQDMYLPGRTGTGMDDIVIAVDVSGSVSESELNEFVAEMQAIKVDCLPPTTHVVYFHHVVARHDEFGQDDEIVITVPGTGGTAFAPIFRFIEDHDLRPCACVVLTDLYASDFGPVPGYPVIWATTGSTTAPFGEVIKLRS